MNVLSLCGPESGIPKNPSVRLLSYSKASEKVSVNLMLKTAAVACQLCFVFNCTYAQMFRFFCHI